MTTPDGVADLVQRWGAAEERNDAKRLEGLLANVHIGPLQAASWAPASE